MKAAVFLIAAFLLAPTLRAGDTPLLRPGPVQIHRLAIALPKGFDWIELSPCPTGALRPGHSEIVPTRQRHERPYAPPKMRIDGPFRLGRVSLEEFFDEEWQATFGGAAHSVQPKLVDEERAERVGAVRDDGHLFRVGLFVRIVDGDAYSMKVTVPENASASWEVLVDAARSADRSSKLQSAHGDPFDSGR